MSAGSVFSCFLFYFPGVNGLDLASTTLCLDGEESDGSRAEENELESELDSADGNWRAGRHRFSSLNKMFCVQYGEHLSL